MEDLTKSFVHKRFDERKVNRVHEKHETRGSSGISGKGLKRMTRINEKGDNIGSFGSGSGTRAKPQKKDTRVVNGKDEGDSRNTRVNYEAKTCLICTDEILKDQPIWQCPECYCWAFHLPCLQKWVQKSAGAPTWTCPNCIQDLPASIFPNAYYCFCGKTKNPPLDAWIQPHACNEICGKALKPDCGHTCTDTCHPGACTTCSRTTKVSCFCGKKEEMRLCLEKKFSCSKPCDKKLSCKAHTCPLVCHEGACPPCQHKEVYPCRCGRKEELKVCCKSDFSCETVCGKVYPCRHHKCEKMCHEGACGNCPRDGPRTCYCGKKTISKPCYEDVTESCFGTCDKFLACGVHKCHDKCHRGPCPPCTEDVVKSCRCERAKRRRVKCAVEETLCSYKCTTVQNCTKHHCNRRCCPGNCPPCNRPCNAMLNCKNHQCLSTCHPGTCTICPLTMRLRCPCGEIVKIVPCGRKYMLDHVVYRKCRGEHREETVPCTVDYLNCMEPCGNVLSCGNHVCTGTCHVVTKRRKLVCVEQNFEDEQGNVFTQVLEKVVDLKPEQGDDDPFGDDQIFDNCEEDSCVTCTLPCIKLRPRYCTHPCPLPCHLNDCPDCEQRNCWCTMVRLFIPCWKLSELDELQKLEKIAKNNDILTNLRQLQRNRGDEGTDSKALDNLKKLITLEDFEISAESVIEQLEELLNIVSCEGKCGKDLEFCKHPCQTICHPGRCPKECYEKVNVKCECGHLRKKWTCQEVQQRIENLGIKEYNTKILPCSDACKKVKKEREELKRKKNEDRIQREAREREEKEREKEQQQQLAAAVNKNKQSKFITGKPSVTDKLSHAVETKALQAIQSRINSEKTMWSPADLAQILAAAGVVFLVMFVIYLKLTE